LGSLLPKLLLSFGESGLIALKKEDKNTFWIVLAGVTLLLVYSFFWYPLRSQMDAGFHIAALYQLSIFAPMETYNSVYYYAFVGMCSIPFKVFHSLGIIEIPTLLHLSVIASNILLLLVFLVGMLRVGHVLEFSRRERFLFCALTVFVPVIITSFFMLRPENLIFALAPWIIISFLALVFKNLETKSKLYYLFILSIAGGVAGAQKISGIAFLVALICSILFFMPHRKSIFKRMAIPLLCLLISFCFFSVIDYGLSNVWFFQHHADKTPSYKSHPPSLDFFYSVDPTNVWEIPVRRKSPHIESDHFVRSFWNIGIIELYGDFWRYGVLHYKLVQPANDANHYDWAVLRSRIGILGGSVVVAMFILGLITSVRRGYGSSGNDQSITRLRLALSVLVFGSPILLYATTFTIFNPYKADTFKLTYVIMFLPFMYIPIVSMLKYLNKWMQQIVFILLLCCLLIGVLQSIYAPPYFSFVGS